ncbi:uncharacterized protein LOC143155070 isoform X1 [Ptiloglossa arizonensis]|uniref:uncharacterized protein LOC143155070 isoform X1 n=1 Tax=Ptiloglossa arizonensis TaxID=3350558 RepID=UPI003FA0EE6C
MEFCVVHRGDCLVSGGHRIRIPCQQSRNSDREHEADPTMALFALQEIRSCSPLSELPFGKETLTNTKPPQPRMDDHQQILLLQVSSTSCSERSTAYVQIYLTHRNVTPIVN